MSEPRIFKVSVYQAVWEVVTFRTEVPPAEPDPVGYIRARYDKLLDDAARTGGDAFVVEPGLLLDGFPADIEIADDAGTVVYAGPEPPIKPAEEPDDADP